MVRALQTLSILALISAGAVFTLCTVKEPGSEPEIGQILSSPSVVEMFKQTGGHGEKNGRKSVSPLIEQAQAFALYLNPPPAPKRNPKHSLEEKQNLVTKDVRPAKSSPKFELHGISYYRSKPEESMALVWEPGSGHRWVKQGAKLGHLVVEQVNRASILYRDGEETHEMAFEPGQASVMFARNRDDKPAPKQSVEPERTAPQSAPSKPPPVRGIRQMPTERITAKRMPGLRELNVDTQ